MAKKPIKVQVVDQKLKAKLQALVATGENMKPVYDVVGRTIATKIRLCFKLGIDPWGKPWLPLKIRKGGQPLRDTGRLVRSITSKPDDKGVSIGTNVFYARVHQRGATITPKKAKRLVFPGPGGKLIFAKKVTVPARPFMPLRPDSNTIALPPAWSGDVVRAMRAYFLTTAEKAKV